MTTHLENHPHAFLDSNNIVQEVYVFDNHDSNLIEEIKLTFGYADAKCCCDYGMAYKNGDFYNGKLYTPQPYPEWTRDEENGTWVAPEGWVNPKDAIFEE